MKIKRKKLSWTPMILFIPLTSTNTPQAYNLKVKGNPAKVAPIIWYTVPFEDIEMEK